MAVSQTVKVVVQIVDQFTKNLKNMAGGVDKLQRKFTQMRETGLDVARVGAAMSAAVVFPVAQAAKFESNLSQVKAVSGATATEMELLRDKAVEMGQKTLFSATEAAEALLILAQVGFSAKESMTALPATLELATAGGLSLERATTIATQALKGMGMEAYQLGRINDVLAVGAAKTNSSVQSLGEALKNAGPAAKAAGMSLEDVVAVIGTLENAGIKASAAGNNVKRMIIQLQKDTPRTKQAMEELNLKVKNADGTFRGLIPILSELGQKNITMSQSAKLFGLYAAAAGAAAARQAKDMVALRDALKDAQGASKKMADTMRDNVLGAFKNLKNALQAFFITITENLMGPIKVLLNTLAALVNAFSKFNEMLGGIPAVLLALTAVAAGMTTALGLMLIVVGQLGKAFGTLPAILSTVRLFMTGITAGAAGFTASTGILATAWTGLTRIIMVNPIGAALTALAGIATIFVGVYNAIRTTTNDLTKLMATMNTLRRSAGELQKVMERGFESDADMEKAKDAARTLKDQLEEVAQKNKEVAAEARKASVQINLQTGEFYDGGKAFEEYKKRLEEVEFDATIERLKGLSLNMRIAQGAGGKLTGAMTVLGGAGAVGAAGITTMSGGLAAMAVKLARTQKDFRTIGINIARFLVTTRKIAGPVAIASTAIAGLGVALSSIGSGNVQEKLGNLGQEFTSGLQGIIVSIRSFTMELGQYWDALLGSINQWSLGGEFSFFENLMKVKAEDIERAKADYATAVQEVLQEGITNGKIDPNWSRATFEEWIRANKEHTANNEHIWRQHYEKLRKDHLKDTQTLATMDEETLRERIVRLNKTLKAEKEAIARANVEYAAAQRARADAQMSGASDEVMKKALDAEAAAYKKVQDATNEYKKTLGSLQVARKRASQVGTEWLADAQKANAEDLAAAKAATNEYKNLSAQMVDAKQKLKDLAQEKGIGSPEYKAALQDVVELHDKIGLSIQNAGSKQEIYKEGVYNLLALLKEEEEEIKAFYDKMNKAAGNAFRSIEHEAGVLADEQLLSSKRTTERQIDNLDEVTLATIDAVNKQLATYFAMNEDERSEAEDTMLDKVEYLERQKQKYKEIYNYAIEQAQEYHRIAAGIEEDLDDMLQREKDRQRDSDRSTMDSQGVLNGMLSEIEELKQAQIKAQQDVLAADQAVQAARKAFHEAETDEEKARQKQLIDNALSNFKQYYDKYKELARKESDVINQIDKQTIEAGETEKQEIRRKAQEARQKENDHYAEQRNKRNRNYDAKDKSDRQKHQVNQQNDREAHRQKMAEIAQREADQLAEIDRKLALARKGNAAETELRTDFTGRQQDFLGGLVTKYEEVAAAEYKVAEHSVKMVTTINEGQQKMAGTLAGNLAANREAQEKAKAALKSAEDQLVSLNKMNDAFRAQEGFINNLVLAYKRFTGELTIPKKIDMGEESIANITSILSNIGVEASKTQAVLNALSEVEIGNPDSTSKLMNDLTEIGLDADQIAELLSNIEMTVDTATFKAGLESAKMDWGDWASVASGALVAVQSQSATISSSLGNFWSSLISGGRTAFGQISTWLSGVRTRLANIGSSILRAFLNPINAVRTAFSGGLGLTAIRAGLNSLFGSLTVWAARAVASLATLGKAGGLVGTVLTAVAQSIMRFGTIAQMSIGGAAATMGKFNVVMWALQAFLIGFQLGDWLQKNFVWARKLGVAIVQYFTGWWEVLKTGGRLIVGLIKAFMSGDWGKVTEAWNESKESFSAWNETIQKMYKDAEKGPPDIAPKVDKDTALADLQAVMDEANAKAAQEQIELEAKITADSEAIADVKDEVTALNETKAEVKVKADTKVAYESIADVNRELEKANVPAKLMVDTTTGEMELHRFSREIERTVSETGTIEFRYKDSVTTEAVSSISEAVHKINQDAVIIPEFQFDEAYFSRELNKVNNWATTAEEQASVTAQVKVETAQAKTEVSDLQKSMDEIEQSAAAAKVTMDQAAMNQTQSKLEEFFSRFKDVFVKLELDSAEAWNDARKLYEYLTKPITKVVNIKYNDPGYSGGGAVRRSHGGPIGSWLQKFASGGTPQHGQLPGEGTRDTVPVLARPGEWFIHNEAAHLWSKLFGPGFMTAINDPWSSAGRQIREALDGSLKFSMGGMVPAMNLPAPVTQSFSSGGRVQPGDTMADLGKVTLEVGGKSFPVMGNKDVIETLKTELGREKLRRSK